jgi:hypothetical protein
VRLPEPEEEHARTNQGATENMDTGAACTFG